MEFFHRIVTVEMSVNIVECNVLGNSLIQTENFVCDRTQKTFWLIHLDVQHRLCAQAIHFMVVLSNLPFFSENHKSNQLHTVSKCIFVSIRNTLCRFLLDRPHSDGVSLSPHSLYKWSSLFCICYKKKKSSFWTILFERKEHIRNNNHWGVSACVRALFSLLPIWRLCVHFACFNKLRNENKGKTPIYHVIQSLKALCPYIYQPIDTYE